MPPAAATTVDTPPAAKNKSKSKKTTPKTKTNTADAVATPTSATKAARADKTKSTQAAAFVFGQEPAADATDAELASLFTAPVAAVPADATEPADAAAPDAADADMGDADEDEDAGSDAEREEAEAAEDARAEKRKPEPRNPEREARTVFVGNLPAATRERDVRALFREYGTIESVRFRSLSLVGQSMQRKTAVMLRHKAATEGSTVHAYVVYATHEAARAALDRNGFEHEGHCLRVDRADRPPEFEPARSIFLGNLPFEATEEEVRACMANAGMVEAIRIVRDKVCLWRSMTESKTAGDIDSYYYSLCLCETGKSGKEKNGAVTRMERQTCAIKRS